MPYVQITWVGGRTPEVKQKLAEHVTQALVNDAGIKAEAVHVTFVDLPATDYATGGVTVAEQRRPK